MQKFALDLFSGSKSVTRALEENGFTVISVDWKKRYKPSICCDILEFPYDQIKVPISVVWASPDCGTFSRNAPAGLWEKETFKYRQYNYTPIHPRSSAAVLYVSKTIEIIKYFAPGLYIIENPIGRIRHLPDIKNFVPYRYSVNYKDFGFDYSKETDIYTNQLFALKTVKTIHCGRGVTNLNSAYARAKVPAQLVNFLINHANL
jgi:site-specific DNA-cytosine methylase